MTLRWLALTALAAMATAAVAETPGLGLADAMALAREQSPEVAAARARDLAGKARLDQAQGYRLPTLRLHETWISTNAPAEVFALELNQEVFDFGDFVTSDPNHPATLGNATTRLELSLPIYTGGQLSGRVEQARLGAQATASNLEWTADRIALEAAQSWVGVALATEQLALLERSLETVEAHVALARAYSDEGLAVRSELLRAEVEQARIEDLVLAARGQVRVAQAALSYRLGEPLGTARSLGELPSVPNQLEPLDHWLASIDGRGDLLAARRQVEAAELERQVEGAARKPTVGLSAHWDWFGAEPFGTDGDSGAILAFASLDLFSGGRRAAAVAAAEAEATAARRDLERFEEGTALAVRDAWEQTATAIERRETAARALAAAAETERITEERFKQGIVKMIDLLDASTARREAETRELVARADSLTSRLRLAGEAGLRPESALGSEPLGNGVTPP